jgi:carbon-monoxide dehydrogenase medium subunit
VKPAPFEYVRVASVAEAVDRLSRYDGNARCLAGGQSLVPLLNMRLMRPSAVIDLNLVRELDGIRPEPGSVRVRALTRYSTLEYSSIVAERLPLLARAVPLVGDRQVRNRGTLGGALCHADPAGEMALVAVTLDASLRAEGPTGPREIPADRFFAGPYTTALGPADVLTDVVFPDHGGSTAVVIEHARRHGDFAIVSVAAVGWRRADGAWERIALGLGGAGDRPVHARRASLSLAGSQLEPARIEAAAALAADDADPASDVRASGEYRRHLIRVHVERALTALATGGQAPR